MFHSPVDPQKLDVFLEINDHLNSRSFDLKGLFDEILKSAMKLTDGESASLLLRDTTGDRLEFIVALGPKSEGVKSFVLRTGEGIAGWVAQHNVPLHVPDVVKDKRFAPQISQEIGYPTQNILAVPLRVLGNCVGVLELINKRNGQDFSGEDLTWLEVFANQAGMAIHNAQSIQHMKDELSQLTSALQTRSAPEVFLSVDPKMTEVLNLVRKFATTESTVLILGENGTGKELIAEKIHQGSPRANGPLIKVNCASLPEHLLESELFGHVKGAFTDAVADRKGRFELANGGTLFLDEIGTLPLLLQAKLLRVLQTRTFEPVGGTVPYTSDVRVIAATNQNLEKAMLEGSFRQDLYYRLHVLPIHVPPLRLRPGDIPFLAGYFLKLLSREYGKTIHGWEDDALEVLEGYPWPGNVRELRNVVERAVLVCGTPLIHSSDWGLPEVDGGSATSELELKTAMNRFKIQWIRKVIRECGGNQTRAAKELGIQRTYLSKLIKEMQWELREKGVENVG